jgi:hypothetical protein
VVLGELRDRRTLLLKKGIMARFVYAVPASRVGYRELHPQALPAGVEYPWHATVGRLLALEYAPGVGAVTGLAGGGHRGGPGRPGGRGQELPHRLRFTAGATAALDAFRADVERRLRPGGDLALLGEWAHKYVGHVVRIAALLHLTQLALRAPASPEDGPGASGAFAPLPTPVADVSEDAVARAVALAPYLAAHARAALGLFADAGKTRGALVLKAWLEGHPRREFTQRDAHQACRRHFDGVDEVAEALDVLEAYGYVQEAPGPPARPGGRWGRPKRRRLLTNPRWLPLPEADPDAPATQDGPAARTFEDAGGTFEDVLSTGTNGAAPSGSGTFEDAEYGEYAPHGEAAPAPDSAPGGSTAAEDATGEATDPRTQRTQRPQNPPYQEGMTPPGAYSIRPQNSPGRPQTSAAGAPRAPGPDAGAEDDEAGPFGGRLADDPARVAYRAARRQGFPFLRLRRGRTFGPGEGAWWRDVGRAEGARDRDALYRVVRHLELGDEDGPTPTGGSPASEAARAGREEADR